MRLKQEIFLLNIAFEFILFSDDLKLSSEIPLSVYSTNVYFLLEKSPGNKQDFHFYRMLHHPYFTSISNVFIMTFRLYLFAGYAGILT